MVAVLEGVNCALLRVDSQSAHQDFYSYYYNRTEVSTSEVA
jgi:hypothetical protein